MKTLRGGTLEITARHGMNKNSTTDTANLVDTFTAQENGKYLFSLVGLQEHGGAPVNQMPAINVAVSTSGGSIEYLTGNASNVMENVAYVNRYYRGGAFIATLSAGDVVTLTMSTGSTGNESYAGVGYFVYKVDAKAQRAEYKKLQVGTTAGTINIGESFDHLCVSMSYQSYLCYCEWDSSDSSHWTRYYGSNAPATYDFVSSSNPAGLNAVDPTNGTFGVSYPSYMTNIMVFYK